MAPPPAKPIRKRNRKRKRRAASSSSSSSDSNSSDSESVPPQKQAPVVVTQAHASEPSSSSSSSSESDSDDSDVPQRVEPTKATPGKVHIKQIPTQERSPSPQPVPIPSFLPSQAEAAEAVEQEKVLKERFRRFWMSSIADAFKDDLEEIRKVSLIEMALRTLLTR